MRREIILDRGDDRVRLDLVLARHLADRPDLSRRRIQQLIASGQVVVNGDQVTRTAARTANGWMVAVDLPDAPPRTKPAAETLALDVRYEDRELLIVSKPPGMVAHPAYRHASGTLLNALLGYLGPAAGVSPRLVTRLDRETSGLVLVAKTAAMHACLSRRGGGAAVTKDYLALVRGKPRPPRGVIDLPLARSVSDRRRVCVDAKGQPSRTAYDVVAALRGPWRGTSLVRCRLLTGRTHQIRVHLAARGWPILGDRVYGTGHGDLTRQALHAWRLQLVHPTTGARILVVAQPPPDLSAVLEEGEGTARLTAFEQATRLRSPDCSDHS